MEKLVSSRRIKRRLKSLAREIESDYKKSSGILPPVLICILNGSVHFFSDLARTLKVDAEIDFIRLKSYDGQDNSKGITVTKDVEIDLKGKMVYIIDDICDTGETIIEALHMVNSKQPLEVKTVTLFKRKGGKELSDFYGFEIGDEWLIGYGFDDFGLKRNEKHVYKI